jgi:hypothetical protein
MEFFSGDRSAWLKVIHHLTPAWKSIQFGTWSADMVWKLFRIVRLIGYAGI